MAITPADEGLHPLVDEKGWQENYVIMAMDAVQSAGIYMHLARLPDHDLFETKLAASIGDLTVHTNIPQALGTTLEVPGLVLDVREPFVSWNISYRGRGHAGPRPEPFVSHVDGGDTPLSFDLNFRANIAPLDLAAGMRTLEIGHTGSAGEHYEQGYVWEGSITVGDRTSAVSGFGMRDHSWGVRHFADGVQRIWFCPMVLDNATVYMAGINFRVAGHDSQFGFRQDADGVTAYRQLQVDVTDGEWLAPRSARLQYGDPADGGITVEAERRVRFANVFMKGWGPLAFASDDHYSTVRTSDGRTGFGIFELNRPLDPLELEGIAFAGREAR